MVSGRRTCSLALLSLLLLGSIGSLMPLASAASLSSQSASWQQPFHFRREILVQNPGMSALHDYPLLLKLNFSQDEVFAASTEIKLFNSNGVEVPSYVVSTQTANDSVVSATLLSFLTIPPQGNSSLWAYYGSPGAGLPVYRAASSTSSAFLGPVSVFLGTPESQSYVTFTYAGTYSQTVESVISTGSQKRTLYGSALFGGGLLPVEGWHTLGNASQFGAVATSSTFTAENLAYTEVEVATNSSLVLFDQITNRGSAPVAGARLSLIINGSQLASLGPLAFSYSENTSLAIASVGGAFLGFSVSPHPSLHLIGSSSQLVDSVVSGGQASQTKGGAPMGVLFSWSAGTLEAGSSFSVKTVFSVSSSPSSIEHSSLSSPGVHVGKEEANGSFFTPSATGLWQGSLALVNESIQASGLQIPLQVHEGSLLPDTVSLNGTATYTLPSPSFQQGVGARWTPSSDKLGDSTAYASPSFWSLSEASYVGRVAVFNYNSSASSDASLVSETSPVLPSNDAYLIINYRATTSFGSGNPSDQQLFAALNVYGTLTGKLTKSVYFPVSGSSSNINNSATCGPGGATRPQLLPKPGFGGYLVGDGTWRTLRDNVSNSLVSATSRFQLVLCAAASTGFIGQMELQARSAGVTVSVPAQKIMGASVGRTGQTIELTLAKGISSSGFGAIANLRLGFQAISSVQMNQTSGATFSSRIPEPSVVVGASFSPRTAPKVLVGVQALVVSMPFAGLLPAISINGTAVSDISVNRGVAIVTESELRAAGLGDPPSTSLMQLVFRGVTLGLRVNDASGNPVGGATVTVEGLGSRTPFTGTTASDGGISFNVVPWNYTVSVVSKGSTIFNSLYNLKSGQSATVVSSVYALTLKAKDTIGETIGAAEISLTGNGYNGTFALDHGSLDLQLPANTNYKVTVYVAGARVYSGTISAYTSGSTVLLNTSYVPSVVELGAVIAVAVALLITAFLLYEPSGRSLLRRVPRLWK
ncbi:MAG: carboxypeptidase-like regulatory domain-containing protein [Thaumarchaeota archaeon]|nr:carboxypeptidase-like regulatory domain-containing protein [Nitrososphaerota archaeon]